MKTLWPREHGAYAQLIAPLAGAIAGGTPRASVALLAIAPCLVFLAHEPAAVALGHRGLRLRVALGGRARVRLAVLLALAAIAGAVGVALAPAAWIGIALIAPPVAAAMLLAVRRAEHTVGGEMIAAAALAGAAVPVALAGGWSLDLALAAWIGWSLGFAATVLAVHRTIAHHRKRGLPRGRGLGWSLAGLTALAVTVATRSPALAVAAPLTGAAAGLAFAPPPATRLRAIGVALTIAAALSAALAWRAACTSS